MMLGNTPYIAARAKSRRQKLADRARLRQLINQSVDQLTVAVGDLGYRTEIDLYAGKLTGGDLVEAALTHNLEVELQEIVDMSNRAIRPLIEIYTLRFEYQNAKAVLRAVHNEISIEEVGNSILPEVNDINTPWLKVVESSDDLKSAALLMRRKSFGSALARVPEDGSLSEYEDALDRHYFDTAVKAMRTAKGAPARFLSRLFASEIDHRNIVNILEASAVGIPSDQLVSLLIPGGRLLPKRSFSTIASGGRGAMLDLLRAGDRFDMSAFEVVLNESESTRSLDPVITWMKAREYAMMQRMSYLHPVSALPIIHYVAMKVQEVNDLRLIVRGRLAGLSAEVLEAHVL
ncbi:V-type ATPase subunit [Candidatus Poseidonia alphae]|nr:V-type ATPase subunit [Candidatus Poseidonia alphae]MDA8638741.1 V-type ATPase subunit [Candidatus Poseidonia alphae]MDA8749843.1 V-type ATPase subunit [Candidatus Poseidonia alphae]MDA8758849.1 V-type ATPase subunit [Candidatus Poseidonia alphae]MDA9168208.1 V-type ATPase subunit [Candidatus Poseidonia alphae]